MELEFVETTLTGTEGGFQIPSVGEHVFDVISAILKPSDASGANCIYLGLRSRQEGILFQETLSLKEENGKLKSGWKIAQFLKALLPGHDDALKEAVKLRWAKTGEELNGVELPDGGRFKIVGGQVGGRVEHYTEEYQGNMRLKARISYIPAGTVSAGAKAPADAKTEVPTFI